ncbi:MAG TPA: hypothetical protein VIH90_01600 [Candidatus Saccharimonadales bacterium]
MSFETPSASQGWGPETPSYQRSHFQEARDALGNPALQEFAKKVGHDVGGAAVRGALENAGVARFDDDGNMKVRKFGAIKAALRPTHTARKAATGAVSGARGYAKEQVVGMARQKVSELYGGQPAIAASPLAPEASDGGFGSWAPTEGSTQAATGFEASGSWGYDPNAQPQQGWGPEDTLPLQQPGQQGAAPQSPAEGGSW